MSRNSNLIRVWRSLSVTARHQLRDLYDGAIASVSCDGRVVNRLVTLTLIDAYDVGGDGRWFRITDLGREVHLEGVDDYLDKGPP